MTEFHGEYINTRYSVQLTAWSRILLEKLTAFQLVKKFPVYGTRRFITAFTSARHLSLSRVISIKSMPPRSTSWRSILILSSHLRLGISSFLFSPCLPTITLCKPLLSPIRATCPAHLILLDLIARTILGVITYRMEQNPSWQANRFSASQLIPRILCNPKLQITKLLIMYFFTRPCHSPSDATVFFIVFYTPFWSV